MSVAVRPEPPTLSLRVHVNTAVALLVTSAGWPVRTGAGLAVSTKKPVVPIGPAMPPEFACTLSTFAPSDSAAGVYVPALHDVVTASSGVIWHSNSAPGAGTPPTSAWNVNVGVLSLVYCDVRPTPGPLSKTTCGSAPPIAQKLA